MSSRQRRSLSKVALPQYTLKVLELFWFKSLTHTLAIIVQNRNSDGEQIFSP